MSDTLGRRVLEKLNIAARTSSGEGTYRAPSLEATTNDSSALSIKIDKDGHDGVWQDWKTGKKGSLAKLALALGLELTKKESERLEKRSSLERYASEHGVDVEAFKLAGWKESTYYDIKTKTTVPARAFPTASGERKR